MLTRKYAQNKERPALAFKSAECMQLLIFYILN